MPVGTFVLRPENADTFCLDLAHEFEQRAHAMSLRSTGQPLHACQRGRSATSSTVLVPESQSLLKPGRQGDLQPQFHGTHAAYKRWFKQLRSLDAFSRSTHANHNLSPNKIIHVTREWKAILNEPSFTKGFQLWWACRPHRYPGFQMTYPIVPCRQTKQPCFVKLLKLKCVHLKRSWSKCWKPKPERPMRRIPTKSSGICGSHRCHQSKCFLISLLPLSQQWSLTSNPFCFDVPAHFDREKSLLTPHGPMKAIIVEEAKVWVENLNNL